MSDDVSSLLVTIGSPTVDIPLDTATIPSPSPPSESILPQTKGSISSDQSTSSSSPQPLALTSHPMVTRSTVGIFKPKVWISQSETDWALIEPMNVKVALVTPQWKLVMDSECVALMRNKTCSLVPYFSLFKML